MNEIVASIIVVYFEESQFVLNKKIENISERNLNMAKFLYNIEFAEADIFTMFNKIMELG